MRVTHLSCGAKSFLAETSSWKRFFCGGFIRAMHAELGLSAPGNAEPQRGASLHFLKSEAASPLRPITHTLPLDVRGRNVIGTAWEMEIE